MSLKSIIIMLDFISPFHCNVFIILTIEKNKLYFFEYN